jgi:hypothetical protein
MDEWTLGLNLESRNVEAWAPIQKRTDLRLYGFNPWISFRATPELKFPNLKAGCYVELMSGRRFTVEADQSVVRAHSSTAPTLPGRSAAFILPASCEEQEVLADITVNRKDETRKNAELPVKSQAPFQNF